MPAALLDLAGVFVGVVLNRLEQRHEARLDVGQLLELVAQAHALPLQCAPVGGGLVARALGQNLQLAHLRLGHAEALADGGLLGD